MVYKKILGLNLSQFDKTPIGTLTTRTINDIESINDIFAEGLDSHHCRSAFDRLHTCCICSMIDWRLTLIMSCSISDFDHRHMVF